MLGLQQLVIAPHTGRFQLYQKKKREKAKLYLFLVWRELGVISAAKRHG